MAELNELTINGSNYTFEDDVARGLAIAEANRAQEAEGNKVDKVAGKGLSTNDYTNAEKAKLAGLENYDDTQVRQLIAQTNANFANYYTKAESYTKAEVQQIVDAIRQFTYEVVQVLPTASASTMNKIYLVPAPKSEDKNTKEEYITIQNGSTYSWEMLGTTSIDLSNYYTKGQTDSAISSALSSALVSYTTTADLTTLLSQKQDVIQDLANIRSGAQAGSTAYQKPQGGIPSTDMSQDVQTSLDKANTALQEHQSLDAYAKNDGYYEGMGVGTADNLTGQTERTDDAMYRKTGGSEEVASGTATIANIKGQTVAWNMLTKNLKARIRNVVFTINNGHITASGMLNDASGNFGSYSMVSGHKIYVSARNYNSSNDNFYLRFNGWGVSIDRNKSVITNSTSGSNYLVPYGGANEELELSLDLFVIDLTLIYGAGNEPTTPEQFEADYFKWFGKPLTYEEYDAGSLRSVQLDSLKTTGFNQYNNGQARVIGGLQYQITGTYTTITLNDETITPDANGLFTPSTTGTLIVTGAGNDTCIHISGDRNGEYEPYEEHSVSLPVTTMTGKLNGEGESVVVFPDGMNKFDNIYTVGDKTFAVVGGQIRAYQDGDATSDTMVTDGVNNTYVALATPLVYEVDDFALPKRYLVDSGGTEEQVQKANIQGLAAILTVLYGVDAVKILDKLPQNYISEKSMDNFLAQLNTVTGGVWNKTWNENTREWDFSFTPNA